MAASRIPGSAGIPLADRVCRAHVRPARFQIAAIGGHGSVQTITRIMIFAAVLFSAATISRAHDRYEIWTIALLRPGHLELAITMSSATAFDLIDPEKKARGTIAEIFEHHRPQFEREAALMYVLTAARKSLTAQKVAVELTEENDIAFRVAYARPPPGPLHFHAAFLKKLGQGFGGILDATDSSGNQLGWEQLSFENPNLEIVVPAPAPLKK